MRMKRRAGTVSSPRGIEMGRSMSSFVRQAVIAVSAVALVVGSAPAQLLPSLGLPQVSLPVPNVPIVGPVAQEVLGTREARQAISPTLDSVRGLPDSIAQSGDSTLLQLRRLRLQQLIREYPRELESDGNGQPIARGRLIAIDPDVGSLQSAAAAGFFPL